MKEIIRVIIILNGLILSARSMDGPPPLEPPRAAANFSLTVLAFMETYQHQTKGILVQKLQQEEDDPRTFPYYSPPACNPRIPDELDHLSEKLNKKLNKISSIILNKLSPQTTFLYKSVKAYYLTPILN